MDLISYWPLMWLGVLILLSLVYARSLVERRKLLKISSFVLRCLAIVLLVLALCRPFVGHNTDRVHVTFLVDVSESIDLNSARQAVEVIRGRIDQLRAGDSWAMYAFASKLRKTTPDELTGQLDRWEQGLSDDIFRRESRLEEALQTVRLTFPGGKAVRVVLFSDGRQTHGRIDQAARDLADEGVDLLVSELQGINRPEVSVVALEPGTHQAYFGERVRLTTTIFSNRPTGAKLRLLNRGVVEAEMTVQLEARDDNRVSLDVAMNTTGSSVWTAELVATEDHFPVNNFASCTIDVKGRAKILVLHEKPAQMRAFTRSLRKQGMDADVRGRHGLPSTVAEMLEFDAIMIADLPATAMTTRQMNCLKSYVSDFGGGLVMLGSENSFGLGGYYKTPVEEVLPIVSRYEKEREKPSMALVLVIDKSGSMSGLPIALARQAGKASVELLSARDQVAVVAFDGSPFAVVEMAPAVDTYGICAAIDRIDAGGGTNMYPAMAMGREMLETASAKVKHMIVLSDGQSMPGDFHGLASEMADQSMTVSTVALGDGSDRALMKAIADIGRGRYYETMDPDMVPRIFTKETVEASRSAIHEEPFTPVRVGQADLLEGIDFDQAPMLLGYVMSRPKPTAQMLLVTEGGDPLLAMGRYGLGVAMAFTSDASPKWASEWMDWAGFGKFWAQTLRACVRKIDSSGIHIRRQDDRQTMRLLIQRKDQAGRSVNGVAWEIIMLDDNGLRTDVPTRQVGLGLYEARIQRPDVGKYTLRLHDKDNRKVKVLHHHEDYPKEYRLASKPPQAFTELPRLSDGDIYAGLPSAKTRQPVQNHFLIASLLCLIGSVLLRRL